MTPTRSRAQSLQLIQFALMAGVLMFGAVILIVHQQASWKPGTLPATIDYAQVACAILAVSLAVLLKGRVRRESDPERRAVLLIAGWAVGEGAALFGAVIFFVTGKGQWYALGLLAMVCTYVLLPAGTTTSVTGRLSAHEG